MVDFTEVPLSTSPEIILGQYLQSFRTQILSLQKHLEILKKIVLQKHQKQNAKELFFQDINKLIQFHHSVKNFLDQYRDTPYMRTEQDIQRLIHLQTLIKTHLSQSERNSRENFGDLRNRVKNSLMDIFDTYVYELKHTITSMKGWMELMKTQANENIEVQALEAFEMHFQTLISTRDQLAVWSTDLPAVFLFYPH